MSVMAAFNHSSWPQAYGHTRHKYPALSRIEIRSKRVHKEWLKKLHFVSMDSESLAIAFMTARLDACCHLKIRTIESDNP